MTPPRLRYYFGIYHWRERGRRLVLALAALALAVRLGRDPARSRRAIALAAGVWGAEVGVDAFTRLLSPPPWHVDVEKYQRFAARLPLDEADHVVDVGCGTGRSLVGVTPSIRDATVVGLDVFDDRVILGNAPELARRNATTAGLDCEVVQGDAATLPFTDDAVDVVTACRVLHDLPKTAAESALSETRRVCVSGGAFGLLELPVPHDEDVDPVDYWRDLVADAGFDVREVERFERRGREYIVVVGST